ncbi:MAG TPA: chemotaxis protein CheB [Spirochaetota bacterium]|nr:chemotaxis protein CheB [Spirochaetota bacterium]
MHGENTSPVFYVGIGASAGGLEALESFFSAMPADSGMAFVVIQHLSPDYKSLMVELLSKRTAMPVRRAEEGMLVEPNTVYLIPPKKELTIFHGKLILREQDHNRGINLPIDVFLRSLADDQAEKAIGIILSGTGSDGVRGIRAIKETGGMIMVQSEESAKFDGMPRSAISTGLADVVLAPDEMPGRLLSFMKCPYAAAERPQALLSDEDGITRIFALLRDQMKVDFTFYKPSTVLRRIERRMTVNQIQDLRDYVRFLELRPGEVSTLHRELLIGVTSFFRDREVFDELCEKQLPALLDSIDQREVRFWVAGCSSGEEAYSLAILAREYLDRSRRTLNVKVFATDIDRDALVHAGNGLYAESIAADLPPGVLTRHFTHRDDRYQVNRTIREMVVFAQHNLIKDPPFTNIDLLSCRNLLIYLQPVLQQKVMEFFNFSLNPQGILLLGTSETPGDMSDFFEPLHHKHKIYRSKGKKRPPLERHFAPHPTKTAGGRYAARLGRGAQALLQREEERVMERLLQAMSDNADSMAAVVNERLELLHIAGSPDGYLRLPSGKLHNDIARLSVREIAIPLTTGLQKVFATGEAVRYTNIRVTRGGAERMAHMHIRLLPGRTGQEPLAGVFLQDMPVARPEPAPGAGHEFDISREAEQRIGDLEQELQFTKENLQATIEELETSNEELQATNEELLASNEELQSTNEELQSVNEELHTVNAEYQIKILELTEMTNDLDNLIAATGIATLFLDENLDIRKFTPELKRIFRILEGDVGRPVTHLTHAIDGADPIEAVRRVTETGAPEEREVRTADGSWFLMRALPYYVNESSVSGVVLTFTDIGTLKRAERAVSESESRYRELFESMRDGYALHEIITDDAGVPADYRFVAVNPAFERLTGLAASDIIGKRVLEAIPGTERHWIETYGRVALTGEPLSFESYSGAIDKHFDVYAFRPAEGMFACVFRDITTRTRALDRLRKVTDVLNATQELTKTGGWEWDVEKREMFWTEEVYRIHRIDPGAIPPGSTEHIDRSVECYDEADRPVIAEAFRRCVEEGVAYDRTFFFTDTQGRRKRIRTAAHPVVSDGRIVRVIGNIVELNDSNTYCNDRTETG